ncbi:MAG TPA: pyridoxal-dependent decarboxylase [Bryobacteraceae bacterium]|jgi:aromatic-L-amino-acid decarboxylase
MQNLNGLDMHPEEFRELAHHAVDWIADYMRDIRHYPAVSRIEPGALIDSLPHDAPETPEPMAAILADFERQIIPAITHWNHPRFHAYFSVSASGPGVLAEMLTAALNVNGMLWKSCPAVTELEQVTLDWLRQWIGLAEDDKWFGIIYDTASISTMHAIAAARELADPTTRTEGGSRNLTMYCSEQAHSSIEKGAISIGLGQHNVRKIGLDDEFRMRPDLLEQAIEKDLADGKKPFCIVAAIGTTATTSVDPVPAIADIAKKHNAWLHIDAAYAGPAAIVPELRHHFAGWERGDSIVLNPHKWLATPIDVSVFYTRHPDILKRAFSLIPDYLKTQEDSKVVNYMDYGVQLGRRFRALKLWFVMRYFGREKLAAMIREHVRLAQLFAEWVRADDRFEVASPVPFSLVNIRLKSASDAANVDLMNRVNESGVAFLSPVVLRGKTCLRIAIGNIKTTEEDMKATWDAIQSAASGLS